MKRKGYLFALTRFGCKLFLAESDVFAFTTLFCWFQHTLT